MALATQSKVHDTTTKRQETVIASRAHRKCT
uniref:Uncharacterized protein n=1 Tax=Anopheles quadriannulatus TaxID=34691 RepID=A0A182X4B8_ANOQN